MSAAASSGSVDELPDMFSVRRIRLDEGERLRAIRLTALADAPGDATTTLARAQAHPPEHWEEAAIANSSGGSQATFFAEMAAEPADEPVGLVGAYANQSGDVNLVGLWSAPGHRDVGVATALLEAVEAWSRDIGAERLRFWVVDRNEYARAFYVDHGFVATGSTMPYELDPRLHQLEMLHKL